MYGALTILWVASSMGGAAIENDIENGGAFSGARHSASFHRGLECEANLGGLGSKLKAAAACKVTRLFIGGENDVVSNVIFKL